jgi:hypothetical protein
LFKSEHLFFIALVAKEKRDRSAVPLINWLNTVLLVTVFAEAPVVPAVRSFGSAFFRGFPLFRLRVVGL